MKLFTLTILELLQKLEKEKSNKDNPYFRELKRKLGEVCQCKNLTIFDIDPSLIHSGRERCKKCGKLVNKEKVEWILSNPLKGVNK